VGSGRNVGLPDEDHVIGDDNCNMVGLVLGGGDVLLGRFVAVTMVVDAWVGDGLESVGNKDGMNGFIGSARIVGLFNAATIVVRVESMVGIGLRTSAVGAIDAMTVENGDLVVVVAVVVDGWNEVTT